MESYSNFVDGQFKGIAKSGPMDVVLALQSSKKLFANPVKPSMSDRVLVIQKLSELLSAQKREIIHRWAAAEGLEAQVIQQTFYPAIEKIIADRLKEVAAFEGDSAQASGLVSIVLPWTASFVYLMKAFVPAYLAGNHIVIKTSSTNPMAGQIFAGLLQQLHQFFSPQQFLPGSVQVLHGNAKDVGEIFTSHPAIRTLIAWGHLATGEKMAAAAVTSFKKVHLGLGYNNAAFILGEVNDEVLRELTKACFQGQGLYPWNINKVFVLETEHEKFIQQWKLYLEKNSSSLGGFHEGIAAAIKLDLNQYHRQVKQLTGERGKVVFGGDFAVNPFQPTVLLDLTHCSTMQQDELDCPMIIVSPVKYLHEMSKWANTSYFGQLAVLFGDAQKAKGLGLKLECGFVGLNRWPVFEMLTAANGVGMKQSFYGNADLSLNSDLFSDKKCVFS